jgi:hypothetical protein
MSFYAGLFQRWHQEGARYLVAGGYAVNFHGFARITADLDILVDYRQENLSRILAAMEAEGYVPRLPVKAADLLDRNLRRIWMEEKGARVFSLFKPDSPLHHIDIFLDDRLPFDSYWEKRKEIPVGGFTVPVISLETLLAMKRDSGRPQDLADIRQLERIGRKDD